MLSERRLVNLDSFSYIIIHLGSSAIVNNQSVSVVGKSLLDFHQYGFVIVT